MIDPEPTSPEPGPDATLSDIQADIDATRHELGATVEALTAKLDVKHQAKQKITQATVDDDGVVRPMVPISVVAMIIVIVGVVVLRRRR